MTDTETYSSPKLSKFINEDYNSDSDSYFIAKFLLKMYGKETILKILQCPSNYNSILGLSDEELDSKLKEYYSRTNICN